jgi:hypothetical protein
MSMILRHGEGGCPAVPDCTKEKIMLKRIVTFGLIAGLSVGTACKKDQPVKAPAAATGSAQREGAASKDTQERSSKPGAPEFSCEAVFEKNKTCVAELVGAIKNAARQRAMEVVAKLPEDKRPAATAKVDENIRKLTPAMKDTFVGGKFLNECKKNWDSKKPEDVKAKDQFEVCFRKATCKEYAECIMKMVEKE